MTSTTRQSTGQRRHSSRRAIRCPSLGCPIDYRLECPYLLPRLALHAQGSVGALYLRVGELSLFSFVDGLPGSCRLQTAPLPVLEVSAVRCARDELSCGYCSRGISAVNMISLRGLAEKLCGGVQS